MTRILNPTEAVVAAGWLRSAGLEVELVDYHLCSLNWLYILALGGFGLELDADQLEVLHCPPPEREQPSAEDLACYRRIERRRRRAVWITLLLFYPFLLLPALVLRWLAPQRPPTAAGAPGG